MPTGARTPWQTAAMRERSPSAVLLLLLSLPAQEPGLPANAIARLEGRVVDAMQRPVPAAKVTAEADGRVLATTLTDGSGEFVFGRLPQTIVVVRAAAATEVGGNWVDLLGTERSFLRLTTLPARKVAGTVRDDAELDATVERDAGQEHVYVLRDGTPDQIAAGRLPVTATHGGLPVPLPPPLQSIRAGADGTWVVRGWPYSDDVHAHLEVQDATAAPLLRTSLAAACCLVLATTATAP